MNRAQHHGLSQQELETLHHYLAPFAEQIERVAVFGSRASGTHRPASDIDLVVYGPVDAQTLDRLYSQFIDSNLPLRVDLVAYEHITNPALKQHIDRTAQLLFSQPDLKTDPRSESMPPPG